MIRLIEAVNKAGVHTIEEDSKYKELLKRRKIARGEAERKKSGTKKLKTEIDYFW